MDHILVIAGAEGVADSILQPLRADGWRITVTADIVWAKHLLRNTRAAGVMIAMKSEYDPDRLKMLSFVHEFCPDTMLIMLHSNSRALAGNDGTKLVQTLDDLGDAPASDAGPISAGLQYLSPAQKRIAELVGQGYPNRKIASTLGLKEQSVRNELSRIYKKMGIWSRVELALVLRNASRSGPEATMQTWNLPLEPNLQARQRLGGGAAI